MTLASGFRVMQMSRQKRSGLILLLFAVVSLGVMAADTEDPPSDTAQTDDIPETSPQPPQIDEGEAETLKDAEKVPPVAPAKPIKQFKPTEQIEADSAVSFPVDI